jgi:hypothetical protein
MGSLVFPSLAAIEVLDVVSWQSLPRSAVVDLTLLLGCGKPAVRTRIMSHQGTPSLERWAAWVGLALACDQEGYVAIASAASQAKEVLRVDRCPVRHERELGRLLGYPECCTAAAAAVGEAELDAWAAVAGGWTYPAAFRLLQPSGYASGASLLSHIPCSATCRPSLDLALEAWSFISHGSEAGSPVLMAHRARLSRQLRP